MAVAIRPVGTCECGAHSWVILTRGHISLIDPEFAPAVGLWNWKAVTSRGIWYAARSQNQFVNGRRITVTVRLHSVIQPRTDGYVVDHANRNTLDNRRSNLRLATASQNATNRKSRSTSLSVYRGVSQRGARWVVVITVSAGRQKYIGSYGSEIEAAFAYDRAALEFHHEFAVLNFPEAKLGSIAA
jgi:hypothetical protein